jgi:hypothetical protein
MADQFDKDALNDYNDSLRETLNYSRQLSENVLRLAGRMANLTQEARMTRRLTSELESDVKKTIGLTDKLYAGKLKEKEAQNQLNQLQNKYQKYITDAANSSSDLGIYLAEVNQKQLDYQTRINTLLADESQIKSEIRQADFNIDALQREIAAKEAQKVNANVTQRQLLQQEIQQRQNIVQQLQQDIKAYESISRENQKNLNKTQELLTATDKVIEANDTLLAGYQQLIKDGETLVAEAKAYSKTVDGLAEKFKDIQGILAPFTAIFNFLRKVAFDVSDQVTKLQKGLMLSSDEAYNVRNEFNELAVASENVLITTNALVASNAALGKQLGFNARFSNDAVVEFTKLTKQIGLSEEAAGGLAKFAKANGMTLKETKTVALGVSQQLSSQYGIQLDQREVLEEIGKISGQTLAMFKANPAALAQAVAQAKLLGTNLDIAKKQASALLDFESSIENELQAELITGQQFNLERARSASLTGDLTTTMKELNNQGIDFNRFSNMNVIAQEKVAAALGLSTDELSDQLLKQQYMNMSREQVVALAGEEVANRLEAVSAQDKFNAAVEKMQDLFAKIAGGPLGQLAEMMAGLLDNSFALSAILGTIAGISMTKLIVGLAASAVQAGLLAAGTLTANAALTFGIGTAIVIGALAAGMAAYSSAQQQAIEPAGDMFSSKGKTIVSTKEGGLFSLSDNDDLAVAPGIGDMISKSQNPSTTVVQQDNSALLSAVNTLITETKNTNSGLAQLNSKQAVVKVDSQSLGTAQIIGNYNLA